MPLPLPLTLGLSAPACILTARELLRRDIADPEQPLLVVVPTREAVRQLREQLAIEAAQGNDNSAVICPRIISASQLTAGQSENVASPLLQQAALFCVLKREHASFPHLLPQNGHWSHGDYLAKAGQFRQLYTTLCHEGIAADGSSPAAVALAGQNPVWQELFALYPLFCDELHRHGYLAPAEAPPLPLTAATRVILACVPSLSERARQQLEQSGLCIETWLHTDELHEDPGWFDAWGRPGSNWLAAPSEDVLGLEQDDWQQGLIVCGDAERMAQETARAAGHCDGESVAIGVCDSGMESAVAEAFARHGICTVRPRGIPFTASGWYRLLLVLMRLAELLEETGHRAHETDALSAEHVSALLRNPILSTGLELGNTARAAREADILMQRNLPASLGTMHHFAPEPLRTALQPLGCWLSTVLACSEQLLLGLRELASRQLVQGEASAQEEAAAIATDFTEQMDSLCRELLESGWAKELPVLSTLNLIASTGNAANAPHPPHALTLRGWLELSFAPESRLILAGLHDGIIPERWPATPYLTPQVMETLGLPRDEARAARDAYLLRSLYRCRPGKVRAIFSLLNARRDPLFPSSVFFRLTPQAQLPGLVAHFFDRRRATLSTAQLPYDASGWNYRQLALSKRPEDIAALARLSFRDLGLPNPMEGRSYSPSALRQFLSCPLRFWLAKHNNVQDQSLSPTQRDLAASDMGSYLHDALEAFVRRHPNEAAFRAAFPAATAASEDTLLSLLEQELDATFSDTYEKMHGQPEWLPRQLQCDAMRRRLRAYARIQLRLWEEGWECACDAEGALMLEYPVNWQLFGHPLSFRIDRIDTRLNPKNGQREYRVLDYKTGSITTCYFNHLEVLPLPHVRQNLHLLDAELEPAVGYGKGNTRHAELRWTDLQLPLYTAWALEYFGGSPVSSAYIHLSRTPSTSRVVAWGDSAKDPDFFAMRSVPKNTHYPEVLAESLYTNSMRWAQFALNSLAEGRCFVSAEMMGWNAPDEQRDVFGDIFSLTPLTQALLSFPEPH